MNVGLHFSILVVDDEPSVLQILTRSLDLSDYTVIAAESGAAALSAVLARETPFDLLVTDIRMSGVDGPTLALRARELHPSTDVLFISGFAEDPSSGRIPGDAFFLLKPFSPELFLETVQQILQSRTPQGGFSILPVNG